MSSSGSIHRFNQVSLDPKSNDSALIRDGKVDKGTYRGEGHVKTEVEIEVMCLSHADSHKTLGARHGTVNLRTSGKNQHSQKLHFRLLASRTVRK